MVKELGIRRWRVALLLSGVALVTFALAVRSPNVVHGRLIIRGGVPILRNGVATSDSPIRNAEITFAAVNRPGNKATVHTDSDGRFVIELKPGRYIISTANGPVFEQPYLSEPPPANVVEIRTAGQSLTLVIFGP